MKNLFTLSAMYGFQLTPEHVEKFGVEMEEDKFRQTFNIPEDKTPNNAYRRTIGYKVENLIPVVNSFNLSFEGVDETIKQIYLIEVENQKVLKQNSITAHRVGRANEIQKKIDEYLSFADAIELKDKSEKAKGVSTKKEKSEKTTVKKAKAHSKDKKEDLPVGDFQYTEEDIEKYLKQPKSVKKLLLLAEIKPKDKILEEVNKEDYWIALRASEYVEIIFAMREFYKGQTDKAKKTLRSKMPK